MATSYGALCTDFVFETKLSVKLPLPQERDTLMHFFERVQKAHPAMDRFRKSRGEFLLETARDADEGDGLGIIPPETPDDGASYRWVSIADRMLRCGIVNPESMELALKQHDLILKNAPHFLGISPLDVESYELVFGFELESQLDHDEIVRAALLESSPLGEAMAGFHMVELQPYGTMALSRDGRVQATIEVKTRRKTKGGDASRYAHEPLVVYLIVRRLAPFHSLEDLGKTLAPLFKNAERLAAERVIPHVLTPISRLIVPGK